MPIQDFSLNAEGMQRIQVSWNSESEPATVQLDDILSFSPPQTAGFQPWR